MTQDQPGDEGSETDGGQRRKMLLKNRQPLPDGVVDHWVKSQLQQVYDDVVLEPVPEDFLSLLQKIDQNSR